MALKLADRIKENSNTTGLGPFHMNGAVQGFQAMTSALADGDQAYFAATDNASTWVVFLGTFTLATNMVAVNTVLASSPGYAGFSVAPTVWIDAPGALLSKLLAIMPSNDNVVGVNLAQTLTQKTISDQLTFTAATGFALYSGAAARSYHAGVVTLGDDPTYNPGVFSGLNLSLNQNSGIYINVRNPNTSTGGAAGIAVSNSANTLQLALMGTNRTASGPILADMGVVYSGMASNGLLLGTQASAPIVFAVGAAEAARLHTTGNFGIGITPAASNAIDVLRNGNSAWGINIKNASNGNAAATSINVTNDANRGGGFYLYGSGVGSGGALFGGDTLLVNSSALNGMSILVQQNAPIRFGLGATCVEGMRFLFDTSAQQQFSLCVMRVNTWQGGAFSFATGTTNTAGAGDIIHNGNPNSGVHGVWMLYQNYTPNNSASEFYRCMDGASVTRFMVASNGGISNYSANNVNLSDAKLKTDIQQLKGDVLVKLWAAHRDMPWSRYRYKDQTHRDFNYGYLAQDVQKAFPELVEDYPDLKFKDPNDDSIERVTDGRLGVYLEDLHNIAHAVLSEAQRRIDALEAKIKQLETRH